MKVTRTKLPEVLLIEPRVFADDRGHFFESWNSRSFAEATGLAVDFVQDNESRSPRRRAARHPLSSRPAPGQARTRCIGLRARRRRRSAAILGAVRTVGRSRTERRQLSSVVDPARIRTRVPGQKRISDLPLKTTDYWIAEFDRGIRWDDPEIGIEWGLSDAPVLAPKDLGAPLLAAAEVYD